MESRMEVPQELKTRTTMSWTLYLFLLTLSSTFIQHSLTSSLSGIFFLLLPFMKSNNCLSIYLSSWRVPCSYLFLLKLISQQCESRQRGRFPFSKSPWAIQTKYLVPICLDYQGHFWITKLVAISLNHYVPFFLTRKPTPKAILHKPQIICSLIYKFLLYHLIHTLAAFSKYVNHLYNI